MKNYLLLLLLCLGLQSLVAQAQISAIKSIPVEFGTSEIKPLFPGGNAEFSKFISKNFTAPDVEGLNGTVIISFVIELDGSLTDIKVVKDIGSGSGQAAMNMIKKSPKWSPGQMEGKAVRVRYELPVTIRNY